MVETPTRPSESQRVADEVGAHCEGALIAAALTAPDALDRVDELPLPSDFIVGWNGIYWECVLETRSKGEFSIVRFTEALKERGFSLEQVNGLLRFVNEAFLYREEVVSSAQFLKNRRLVLRSQMCAREFLETLEHEPYWKAPGHLDRLQQQLADIGAGAAVGQTWAFGEQVSSQRAACVSTGISALDDKLGGIELSAFGIIGARPSIGKSALACDIALNMASRGDGVGVFSLEMPSYSLQCRMAAAYAYEPGQLYGGNSGNPYYDPFLKEKMPPGRNLERMRSALEDVRKMPVAFDDHKGLRVSDIRARSRQLKTIMEARGNPLKAIFVDHIGHIGVEINRSGNRTAEITDITKGLMDMAGELGIAVIGLSQLNRAVEGRADKRPTLADLRDSGSLEQDASWVTFLYREEYYADREAADPDAKPKKVERNTMEVIIAKQRNGPVATVKLFCEMGANAILDWRDVEHARAA